MENTRFNGLAGKARRVRKLNRVTRMYAQQMIDEYLYPESDSWRPERYIPIRGRSEFFPSAASVSHEQERLLGIPGERDVPDGAVAARVLRDDEFLHERAVALEHLDPVVGAIAHVDQAVI